ncbi:hypothetical protein A3D80_00905 [Candidatus Roizmanbacteria bacterium RIFCSPHIGHO2_02_FULL_40_13b]|uniref:Undecaprenyl-diphosphatase n=1 Tax=Candidatus Roizmanbacteria bacterium RIFCSPHIGHO2_01_FULL_39_24 TaxID=1802032 RepID=A0A1F7GJK2_9BACT|nr:MAG: hypothetical protein A2799_02270 [Candidatus Roizmanbacteria bacterium RIFCSPHIGHO2_01_FULL_39_24]OGK26255.1 MAG: hypothetical protein A3D80_00905 [Candidatus Roizmanbacteria bacterium RIFCSPHIGHO2_02_FULL_40_13b]OGK48890.1 MAG: hypothetical protein A3A56_01665 [Candidatus Roizmanbacteria bacterium RIFCSPLOWO2_01_FULL_40_32]OGK57557.1 MAG: hypothetical protein A3H83_01895 [Candidatus Roizmanbacteria bacterium RIFCSPLOWO2_02_FULL_39_8]
MSIIHALILGIVEGLTEFLPISSTAHLIITSKFLGLTQSGFTTFFEVFIQSGAILAVVLLYFRYILAHQKYVRSILLSFIPTALVGLILHDTIKTSFFTSPVLIYSSLIVVGILFIIIEHLVRMKKFSLTKHVEDISLQEALIFGLFQALAIVPGVSRAGAVMVGMMVRGYKREEAAVYSFLLAVPTLFAASALDLLKTDMSLLTNSSNALALLIGFTVSFLTAYIVIKWFISYLQRNTLTIFGIYRIVLGATLILMH